MCNDPEEIPAWAVLLPVAEPTVWCGNCSTAVDPEQLQTPDEECGLLLCPACGAELPWDGPGGFPVERWYPSRVATPTRSTKHRCPAAVTESMATTGRYKG